MLFRSYFIELFFRNTTESQIRQMVEPKYREFGFQLKTITKIEKAIWLPGLPDPNYLILEFEKIGQKDSAVSFLLVAGGFEVFVMLFLAFGMLGTVKGYKTNADILRTIDNVTKDAVRTIIGSNPIIKTTEARTANGLVHGNWIRTDPEQGLQILETAGVGQDTKTLDVGHGAGEYGFISTIILDADFTGAEISNEFMAVSQLAGYELRTMLHGRKLQLLHGEIRDLASQKKVDIKLFDVVLYVLGSVGNPTAEIDLIT